MWKRKNIWFLCPACDKKLVVGAEAAGYRSACPECGRNIPIPMRSTAWPKWVRTAALYAAHMAALTSCIAAGWWWASRDADATAGKGEAERRPAAEAPAATAASTSSTAVAETEPAAGGESDLRSQHRDLQGRYNKLVNWMIDNYRGKYPLPERLVDRLRIAPVDDTLDVHPDLVEMLRITPQEKALIKDIFDYVRTNLSEAEMDQALITEQKPERITFSIPPYPEVGRQLREDLYASLEQTLGTPRFDRMVDVAEEEMRASFGYFGEAQRTLTFEVIYPAREGDHPPYVLIRDGWVMPDGDSVRLTKVTETAVTELPVTYRTYGDWLPEEVKRHAMP